mmetsp:Transcript_131074/g.407635  ORF Transcript_131074/g.407635 Transcript_131074/m.407635 type:complete len:346 (-) Transcript_131074:111-1148(-)
MDCPKHSRKASSEISASAKASMTRCTGSCSSCEIRSSAAKKERRALTKRLPLSRSSGDMPENMPESQSRLLFSRPLRRCCEARPESELCPPRDAGEPVLSPSASAARRIEGQPWRHSDSQSFAYSLSSSWHCGRWCERNLASCCLSARACCTPRRSSHTFSGAERSRLGHGAGTSSAAGSFSTTSLCSVFRSCVLARTASPSTSTVRPVPTDFRYTAVPDTMCPGWSAWTAKRTSTSRGPPRKRRTSLARVTPRRRSGLGASGATMRKATLLSLRIVLVFVSRTNVTAEPLSGLLQTTSSPRRPNQRPVCPRRKTASPGLSAPPRPAVSRTSWHRLWSASIESSS